MDSQKPAHAVNVGISILPQPALRRMPVKHNCASNCAGGGMLDRAAAPASLTISKQNELVSFACSNPFGAIEMQRNPSTSTKVSQEFAPHQIIRIYAASFFNAIQEAQSVLEYAVENDLTITAAEFSDDRLYMRSDKPSQVCLAIQLDRSGITKSRRDSIDRQQENRLRDLLDVDDLPF